LTPADVSDPSAVSLKLLTTGVRWVVVQERDLVRPGDTAVISAAGFDEVPATVTSGSSFRVYRRR
jgi:hypothetical protein